MPTAPEVAENLADFRVEVAERFGSVEKNMGSDNHRNRKSG